ncbi:MAG: N-acetylneuraminate synthase family protein [Candidatus Hodarchaeota archaeon]
MRSLKESINKKPYFIVAEVGLNHDGSLGNAIRFIEEAKDAGVDAVKFQLHIGEAETLPTAPTPSHFQLEGRMEMYKRTAFTTEEWKKLKDYAHSKELFFLVSPFSHEAVDVLEEVGIDGYKIPSGEVTNLPLLEYINSKNKPVLLSTGMSDWDEIQNAIDALNENLVVIFQCTSKYPLNPEGVGLNVIEEMKKRYSKLAIGLSDHTTNDWTAIAAFMKGARIFEKHFTLSKKLYGADARFSFEPEELARYVQGIKFIHSVLQNPIDKSDLTPHADAKRVYEKSIVTARDLKGGHRLREEDLAFKKPGDGIRADRYKEIIGKELKQDIPKNEKILLKHLK